MATTNLQRAKWIEAELYNLAALERELSPPTDPLDLVEAETELRHWRTPVLGRGEVS